MTTTSLNTFNARDTLKVGGTEYQIYRLDALAKAGVGHVDRLPFSLRILLENLLRREDGNAVPRSDIEALATWLPPSAEASRQGDNATPPAAPAGASSKRDNADSAKGASSPPAAPAGATSPPAPASAGTSSPPAAQAGASAPEPANTTTEIAFMPARVLLQDLTGVPAVVDLAAMREAIKTLGGDPKLISPQVPADLVIDHSVQVDAFGSDEAFAINAHMEMQRNKERYGLLRWAGKAFDDFMVTPPDAGIVHQINLEYLASVVFTSNKSGVLEAYPDTLIGLDSHTTMINGLGVLGWGVGGIEAEAAMLGQPVSMLIPDVVGFQFTGALKEGTTATDLVLTVTQMLRQLGVVGKFVEFYGEGLSALPLATQATIANMSPEYGATVGYFPVDQGTLDYLRLTGRGQSVKLVEAYCKEQGLFRTGDSPDPLFSETLSLDLSTVEPSIAGPKRPQDRVLLSQAKQSFKDTLVEMVAEGEREKRVSVSGNGNSYELGHGSIVIAAITSCTNTSNPDVMVGAGLLAKKALERGLTPQPWVKSSLAPGSKVVIDYLEAAGLLSPLQQMGFYLVGYGCTTCIGNSGPLLAPVSKAVEEGGLLAAAVLSGNRNFEGRIHAEVKANYLASPPLVVAYALAGTMDIDLQNEPLGQGDDGKDVYLRDIWPSQVEIQAAVSTINSDMFTSGYSTMYDGTDEWNALEIPSGELFAWEASSTYIKLPPFFDGITKQHESQPDITSARVLVMVGDSVTTDHISPAGAIAKSSPAGRYLIEQGVEPKDFNTYGARRGNHEVMMRGTFGNIRLRNELAPGTEGPWTQYLPGGEKMSIYDAAMRYREESTPLIVLAGKEVGTGSSRDWAAKGPLLLGVRAVIAESIERIHRSNLIGMGILPLVYEDGESRESLGLTGRESYDITGIASGLSPKQKLSVRATADDGKETTFSVIARIDTPVEVDYYQHGGILPFVLRQLAN